MLTKTPPLSNNPEEAEVKAPSKRRKRYLPREIQTLDVPVDQTPNLIDTAYAILGPRLSENRNGFLLDGKPANTDKVLAAANLKYKDAA